MHDDNEHYHDLEGPAANTSMHNSINTNARASTLAGTEQIERSSKQPKVGVGENAGGGGLLVATDLRPAAARGGSRQ